MLRIALSVGDEKAVNKLLEELNNASTPQFLLLKAFRAVFLGAFIHAQEYLQRIPRADFDADTAINCAALCLLYNGKANEAIKVYGQLIQKSSEPLYINLKAISELACSTVEKSELLNDFVKKRIA
ncbi:unnamed protein product [Nippostrongylus brasiliensis]|uniref:TPR_REGION domain-containing protein n=1 Tax=Nippostrongylus brasiliensis TaxID=27835 RepID=A0A0N4Y9K1_NIPBR|nr:unnamed protein product [Nippostrongylus brasiliensis]